MSHHDWLRRLERRLPSQPIDQDVLALQLASMDLCTTGARLGPQVVESDAPDHPLAGVRRGDVLTVWRRPTDLDAIRNRLHELGAKVAARVARKRRRRSVKAKGAKPRRKDGER